MKHFITLMAVLLSVYSSYTQDFVFAKQIKSSESSYYSLDNIQSLVSNDNFYISGIYSDTIKVDTVVKIQTAPLSSTQGNSFLAKYDKSGTLIKVLSNTGSGVFRINTIASDKIGNIYLNAITLGVIYFGNASFSTDKDIFSYVIIKLDSNLNMLWQKVLSNNYPNYDIKLNYMILNSDDEVVINGTIGSDYDLDGILISKSKGDLFTAKLNPSNGKAQWVSQIKSGTGCFTSNFKLVCDRDKDVILVAQFEVLSSSAQRFLIFNNSDTLTLNPSKMRGMFLAKYQNNGSYSWVRRLDSLGSNSPSNIATDTSNNIFIGCNLLYKYNPTGNLVWAKNFGGGYIVDLSNNRSFNYLVLRFTDSITIENQRIYAEGKNFMLLKTSTDTCKIQWHTKAYRLSYFNSLHTSLKGVSCISGKTIEDMTIGKNSFFNDDKTIGYMLCFNDKEQYPVSGNKIKGKVFNDEDGNCSMNAESTLSDIGIITYPGPFYSATDSSGNFEVFVDTGIYHVKQLSLIGNAIKIDQPCGLNINDVTFNSLGNIDTTSIFPNQFSVCNLIKTYISRDIAVDYCKSNGQTTITIKNIGFDTVFNVTAKLRYPGNSIFPLYSTPNWSSYSAVDSTVLFNINHIPPKSSAIIDVFDTVYCNSVMPSKYFSFNLKAEPLNICYANDSSMNYSNYQWTLLLTVGLNEFNTSEHKVEIYPNPTNSILYASIKEGEISDIVIYNFIGQKVKESNTSKIDLGDLKSGIYFVSVIDSAQRIFNSKVIKQ